MNRRKFVKGIGAISGLGALTGFYSWQIEPHWLEFVYRKMPIKNLPGDLVGKTLMQISDVHVGPLVSDRYLKKSFLKAQRLQPDFVVYTGDYIHYQDEGVFAQLNAMMPHFVKGKLGTVGILGNHDFGMKWAQPKIADTVTEILDTNGIDPLRNSQQELQGLNIIGIDDYWGTNFFPEKALQKHDPDKANLVLCHNPDVCDLNIWNGYQGWILAGHTHGGQVRPPLMDPPILPVENKNYDAGLFTFNDGRKLYINRALGHLWQVRFTVRPEITVFELTKA